MSFRIMSILLWVGLFASAEPGQNAAAPCSNAGTPDRACDDQPLDRRDLELTKHLEKGGLALDYRLLFRQDESGLAGPVDRNRTFKTGDRIAFEFKASESGYLYVLAEQASHKWALLFPSALSSKDINAINANDTVRAPAEGWWRFVEPVGKERLLVVFVDDPTDSAKLLAAYRNSSEPTAAPEPLDAVEQFRQQLAARDLTPELIEKPTTPDGKPFVAHVWTPNSKLSIEITLKHQ